MSNLGFHKAVEAEGMVAQTAVGDRYVVEEMRKQLQLWWRTIRTYHYP